MMKAAIRRVIAAAIILAAMAGTAPAAACLQQVRIEFEPGETNIVNQAAIADFIRIPAYGPRQKLDVRITAPTHDLALRRVNALLDLLASQGLDRDWIRTRAARDTGERAVMIAWPGPAVPAGKSALAQAATPRSGCGG